MVRLVATLTAGFAAVLRLAGLEVVEVDADLAVVALTGVFLVPATAGFAFADLGLLDVALAKAVFPSGLAGAALRSLTGFSPQISSSL